MNRITYRILIGFLIAVLIAFAVPISNLKIYASENVYETSWKEYNFGSENKGFYLEPAEAGKYPVLIFVHGQGGVNGIPRTDLRNLVEYWTSMGYMDEMVIILPSIEKGTAPSEFEAFRYWGQWESRSGLLGQKIKEGSLSSKIDTNADIYVTGYSCGAAAALAAGVSNKQYFSQIGAFSPFQGYYLGEKQWGWFNYASELTYADGADVFISYGDGEVTVQEPNFKTVSERFEKAISANNNSSVSVSLYSFDSYYGTHAWKLFSAELFAYLYLQKNGAMPSDEIIKSAINPPSICTVSFNANGHGNAPASQPLYSGDKATKPADPSASGYTFAGWYTDSACTSTYDFNTAVTSNITLYAKWTVVSTT